MPVCRLTSTKDHRGCRRDHGKHEYGSQPPAVGPEGHKREWGLNLEPESLSQPRQVMFQTGSAFRPFGGIATGIGGPASPNASEPAAITDDLAPGAKQHPGEIAKVIEIPIERVTLGLPCPAMVVHPVGVVGDPVELTVAYERLAANEAATRLS